MKVSRAWFGRFLQQQSLFLSAAAVVAGVFWATGQEINPLRVSLYSLLYGNLVSLSMVRLGAFLGNRGFPYNWLFLALSLALVVPPIYVVTTTIVWLLVPPSQESLWSLISGGWRFPVIVIVVFTVVVFVYRTTKERLDKRNQELQRTVALGTAQLELQEQELQRAREIQQSLLPKEIPQLAGFEIAAAWRPALAVSGDYFDVFKLGEHRLGICIADVAGKGVSAALLMANVQAAVRAFANEAEQPAVLCSKVNQLLCGNIATGKFVTFLYGVLDRERRTFQFCNAGHLSPILVSPAGSRTLNGGGAVLGVFASWQYEQAQIDLHSDDRMLLFTDGISEACDTEDREFGEAQLADVAQQNCSGNAGELNVAVMSRVDAFCRSQFQDDATLLVISAR